MTRSKLIWMIVLSLLATCTLIASPAIAQQNTAQPVEVVNDKRQPVPTLEVNQPYEDACLIDFNGGNFGECRFQRIPSGKRLVIQEFDSWVFVEQDVAPTFISISTSRVIAHYFTSTLMSSGKGSNSFATHQETHLYVGPNFDRPSCNVGVIIKSKGSSSCQISGFLVDAP